MVSGVQERMPFLIGMSAPGPKGDLMRAAIYCSVLLGLAWLLASVATGASVVYSTQPLMKGVQAADLIVRGRLIEISTQTYTQGAQRRRCGLNFVIKPTRTYKGTPEETVAIAAYNNPVVLPYHEVKIGDELLLLLKRARKDEDPYDVPDVILDKLSPQKLACIRRLATWRLTAASESAFALVTRGSNEASKADSTWIAFLGSDTTMPTADGVQDRSYRETCSGEACARDPTRVVPWAFVEQEMLKWLAPTVRNH